MKNAKGGPLSIGAIFYAKMLAFMLLTITIGVAKAQPLTLVKDINNAQIANLRNAIVYAVGNKIYISDGTANGSKVVYTGAANATILQTEPDALAFFFVERTPTSAKALRFNRKRVEVLTEGTSITEFEFNSGVFKYVVNGNQLWTATYNTGPKLVKTFATPIKKIVGNLVATANSVWSIDYNSGTATLTRDGFTEIGEFGDGLFAANDGGFNGTELWTIGSPTSAYLVQDINAGTASSNPRNFFSNAFTATSSGQNGVYITGFNVPPRLLVSAPLSSELKALSYSFGISQYGQGTQFLLYSEKTSSGIVLNAVQVDTPAFKREIARFTTGDIIFSTITNTLFTHVNPNGTNNIWRLNNLNPAELTVPNASLENVYGILQFVAGDDGKLWRTNFNEPNFIRTLVNDFGAAAKLKIHGGIGTSTPTTYRTEIILSATTNGVTTTYTLDILSPTSTLLRNVADVILAGNEYSSFPNSFHEINRKILFNATDGENGEELWRTDGTTAGTSLFKAFSESIYANVGKSFKDNGFVYYENANFGTNTFTYWKTDGTTIDSIRSTTAEYQTVKNRFNSGQSYPNLTVGTTKYQTYYSVYSLCNRCPSAYVGGIQRILGADTSFVFSFNYVSNGALPISSLQPLGNKFYFTFHQSQSLTGSEADKRGALWTSDGTAAGTTVVKTFSKRPSDVVVANGKLYFVADDGVNGLALWSSDGTAAGTQILANFPTPTPNLNDFEVNKIYVQGNSLYFVVSRQYTQNATSLYAYRIGGNGITKTLDLSSDTYSSITGGVQVNGNLFLAQTRNDVGTELFKIPLPEAPLGGPLSNQSDLSITQTVLENRTADTMVLNFAITLKNNGSQTATNVKTTFPSLGSFGLNFFSDNPLRDMVPSAGFLTDNYSIWFVPSLGVNQTVTFTYRLVVPKVYIQRKTLRTLTKSDQFDGNAANNSVEYAVELTAEPCTGPIAGKLLVDYYLNQITDASPIVIQNPNAPSGQYLTANGATAFDLSDQYIRRARGYVKPSESGNYRFYVAGDDNVDVYLSTDENPANKQRIVYVNGFTGFGEFNKYASQTSASINLVAGRKYYVEIVNADKFGSDYFNLNWATPTAPTRAAIPLENIESFCGEPVVTNLPDLTLQNLTVTNAELPQGQTLVTKVNVANIGTATTGNFVVKGYLSTDNILSANDLQQILITGGDYTAGYVSPSLVGNFPIPANFQTGQYYLILRVDADNQVLESNEANNTLIHPTLITITTATNNGNYCASKAVAPWEYAISNVTLNTLNNNSDKFKDFSTLGYSDYTNLSTPLMKGQTYPLSITPLLSWIGNLPNAYARVWIDFNQNKTFETNEMVLERTNANPLTQNVLIPTTATLGTTRMRVSLKNGSYPTACETFEKGEVEDYTITIQEGTVGGNLPDLTLSNLNVTGTSVAQGGVVNFKFDAKNIGTGSATNAFTIKSYLSTDAVLDANDYQNGSIPTANYAAGASILQIVGAMQVANTVAGGNYYVILKIDADNAITESNETNNVLVSTTTIAVTTTSDGTNDIALTISGDPSVYRQYSTQNFRISAKNNGSAAFTNVKIKFTRPALTVNGGTKVASVGTFQDYCAGGIECSEWTIPTLAANTTATLDVPVYILNPTAAIVASTNLIASTPVDNVTANNTASVSINRSTTPAVQPLIQSKPSQLIPVVIQKINPTITENYIIVELESLVEKTIDFQILNALGNVVLIEKIKIDKGNNKFDFDVSQLPKGMYFIQTSVGKGRNVPMKFVKM